MSLDLATYLKISTIFEIFRELAIKRHVFEDLYPVGEMFASLMSAKILGFSSGFRRFLKI